ncbi:Ergothioneine biosynthesis protein 1 [Psilocybe cubensis]|uniref:Ergothioneine biosynthesis protein 1 n=1 Tax=Psilocybe cubensis TaxID=181762 RepID=A0ACB8GZ11_PSICU|nr:Ergothioneine biosynthesis protein 1 [Psilocybe cubensis]KAH9480612.1 Ergothioneine biosynthesis protein 1 [Psilocybe cubensis]
MPAEIIDVHSLSAEGFPIADIPTQIMNGLSRPFGHKQLPTMLLYDEQGLQLYDDITTAAPEYYLFAAEEEILKNNAHHIVQAMHRGAQISPDEVIVELGAGSLRKTSHILLGLSHFVGKEAPSSAITYYALDLDKHELERTLGDISRSEVGKKLVGKVKTKGMWGTYEDGLRFIEHGGLFARRLPSVDYQFSSRERSPISPISSASSTSNASLTSMSESGSSMPSTPEGSKPPLHVVFLGSSLGNFSRTDAVSFLLSLPLRAGSGDTLLIGLDHDNDAALIEEAYNDSQGYTRRFIFNGLRAAGRNLGDENLFDESKWEYVNTYNSDERCHEAFFRSKCPQIIREPRTGKVIRFSKGELLKIEESIKFSDVDAYSLFTASNLRPVQRWTDKKSQYSLWLLERPPFSFPLLVSPSHPSTKGTRLSYSPFGVPSREEWNELWSCWDFITRQMIPSSMLYQKPIDLRHICLFYLGHIPTFLDIHLSKLLQQPHTEPESFKRGIDPDVDDPTECHPHSEVPIKDEDWPSPINIVKFQASVRARLMRLYDDIDSGRITLTRKIGRVLFMTLEHEAMHAETLLYMLIQRAGSGTIPPPGFVAPPWESLAVTWQEIPAPASSTVTLGPATVSLGHMDFESDDETNSDVETHEFGWDNETPRRDVYVNQFRIEWRPVTNGEFHQFFFGEGKGKVEFPASWVEDDEGIKVRTLYGPISIDIARNWPIVTSYNNLSTYAMVKGGRLPTESELALFYDKYEAGYEGGANVGFRNWHPVPATTGGERAGGKGINGGVWEWTSTVFDAVDGFEPSKLYPGYSMDFFDGKHQVVLGGSYATIPRIAGRRSFRNWYQRNYPYTWAGARVVYDVSV